MRNLKKSNILFTLALILLLTSSVYAIPNPNNDFYVYDSVGILDNNTENYIIETNMELYEKTGAQIVWAIINDLEGMDINSYATAIFDEWDIGSREYDNGLLALIVPDEGEIWIEVGYGLEGILPDSRVKRIIENNIIPNFSQGDYNAGVLSGHDEILTYVESEYNIELSSREGQYNANTNIERENRVPDILMVIGIVIFLFVDFKFFGGWLTLSILRGLGRGGRGGGSGRGGSGGSRGGGGRSGGGGAGGSW